LETKLSSKKKFEGRKPFYATDINTYCILVMGDPIFFLADLSQPLGPGGPTSFYTLSAFPVPYAVKLILLMFLITMEAAESR
jgi:hypothetical protein